jgi:hypothetical protein
MPALLYAGTALCRHCSMPALLYAGFIRALASTPAQRSQISPQYTAAERTGDRSAHRDDVTWRAPPRNCIKDAQVADAAEDALSRRSRSLGVWWKVTGRHGTRCARRPSHYRVRCRKSH